MLFLGHKSIPYYERPIMFSLAGLAPMDLAIIGRRQEYPGQQKERTTRCAD